jgi:hypothetical protein
MQQAAAPQSQLCFPGMPNETTNVNFLIIRAIFASGRLSWRSSLGVRQGVHDEAHPLWRFSDSAMHRACFADWDQAEQFRGIYNKVWPTIMPNHPREMQPDGAIIELGAGPAA